MNNALKALLATASAALLTLPVAALADSITPATYTATLSEGESVTLKKSVTIEQKVTTSKVDVFFLADTTGSMGGVINSVRTSASSILSSISTLGDVAFGVGEYKDFGDSYAYRTNTALTTTAASAQTGINTWSASGGGDWAEANLYALKQVADSTGWRAGSKRILVWFGDAPGHDPSGGVTETATTSALSSKGIVVEALDAGYSWGNLDSYGQATRIASATGGHYYYGVSGSNVVTTIADAITAVTSNYGEVKLAADGLPTGVDVSITPGAYTGSYDRSIARTFDFDVTFDGLAAGDYEFSINALVDGGIVATERDRIVVTGGSGGEPVPEPSTFLLLGAGLAGIGFCRRKFRK